MTTWTRPTVREVLVLLHRWTGLALAAVLLVIVVTGSLLVFKPELDRALNPDLLQAPRTVPAAPLAPQAAAAVESQGPGAVIGAMIFPRPGWPAQVYVQPTKGPVQEVFVAADGAAVLGARPFEGPGLDRRSLMRRTLDLHHTLLAGDFGLKALGWVAVAWIVMTVAGLKLAWPRRGKWRSTFAVKLTRNTQKALFDVHKAVGLAAAAFTLLIGVTALWWNMSYLSQPAAAAVLSVTEPPHAAWSGGTPVDLDQVVARAVAMRPGLTPHGVIYRWGNGVMQVVMDNPRRPPHDEAALYFALKDGRFVGSIEPGVARAGDVYGLWQRPLHTGAFLGLPTRILWLVLGLTPAAMIVTGVWMWLRRSRMRRRA